MYHRLKWMGWVSITGGDDCDDNNAQYYAVQILQHLDYDSTIGYRNNAMALETVTATV